MKSLYWFRNDLRLTDNSVLESALKQSRELAFVYIHDPRLMKQTAAGLPRLGWHRRRFLAQSLENLRDHLRRRGFALVELHGQPENIIPRLMDENDIGSLYFCNECGPEERGVESELILAAHKQGLAIHNGWTQFLVSPDDLPFSLSQMPQTFTDFRIMIEKHGLDSLIRTDDASVQMNLPAHLQLKTAGLRISDFSGACMREVKSVAQDMLQMLPNEKAVYDSVRKADAPRDKFEILHGGSDAALQRLEHYFFESRNVSRYHETRNGMLKSSDSTLFSAWLANGSLSPQIIFHEIRRYEQLHGANQSTYWVIFELLWRDFFKLHLRRTGKLFFFPEGLSRRKELNGTGTDPENLERKLADVMACRTGNSFIDANMRELIQTGFMSNRGRQNVASYMIHDMQIPWTAGAWIFESLLIDYDVASNWGNWAYIAGVSFDPRGGRKFNTQKQQADYDPDGSYLRAWSSQKWTAFENSLC